MTVFPHSPVIDAAPDEALLKEIADQALNAFFAVVCMRLDDLYPDGHTTGDVWPHEAVERENVAVEWIKSHALNHPAISRATEKQNLTEWDFSFKDEGSVWILYPHNDAASLWIAEHVDQDALQWGGGIAVDARYVDQISQGIVEDGLDVQHT